MPKRFMSIGAIVFGTIAAGQVVRICDGLDAAIGTFHVPMPVRWAVAA